MPDLRQEIADIISSEVDCEYADQYKIADRILELIRQAVPTSNRKSCDISEHYMYRYKQGWNSYRAELMKLLEGK